MVVSRPNNDVYVIKTCISTNEHHTTTFAAMENIQGVFSFNDWRAPVLTEEPPYTVEFYNTQGTVVRCAADGRPPPKISWVKRDGMAVAEKVGLRHVRADGSLVFPPFRSDEYRPDIHATVYRCTASNVVGVLASREVHVRAVVSQQFDVRVYDEFVILGNTAVLKCHIPTFVEDFVDVTAWYRDDGRVYHADGTEGGKFSVLPGGELHIRNVQQQDGFRGFRCQVKLRLTGETKQSLTAGRLIVKEPHSTVQPQITHRESEVRVQEGDQVVMPCAAQAYPPPTYHWYKIIDGRRVIVSRDQRVFQYSGTLTVRHAKVDDGGQFICVVNNSVGQQIVTTELVISVALRASVSPSEHRAQLGQSVTFNCSVSGRPEPSVTWVKNLLPVESDGERVRIAALSRLLSISNVRREDKGIYQCLLSNGFDSAQGAASLVLGDASPVLDSVFEEQTLHPGGPVSLKCSATGSPLPQVTWRLDGLPLPDLLRYRVGDYVTRDSRVVSYVNVTSLRSEDGGYYECAASNEVGRISHEARITVTGPPAVRYMPNVTLLAGGKLRVRCPAGGSVSSITWERDGRPLPQNHRQDVLSNGTLVVRQVNRKSDEGRYTCVVKSPEGTSARGDVFIQVLVGPRIDSFSFPADLEEGMRSVAVCAAIAGDSPLTLTWLKDDKPLDPQLNAIVDSVNNFTSTLTFNKVGPKHGGSYTCVATNPAASVNHTAKMVVNVSPYWTVQPSDAMAVVGSHVTLDCQSEGHPTPQIRWKSNSASESASANYQTVISNPHVQILENGSLIIREVSSLDAGDYMCQATNGVSPGLSAVVKLSVHVPAHFATKFQSMTAKKGETLRLSCEAFGEQPLVLRWTKDKQSLENNLPDSSRYSEEQKVNENGTTSTMTISSAERTDSALFSCQTSNKYGEDEQNIQVIILERPDTPKDLQVKGLTSRSATVSWVQPFSGNTPLTGYVLQYLKAPEHSKEGSKLSPESWKEDVKSLTVPPTDVSVDVKGLLPVTTYYFRVFAENTLGRSKSSEIVTTTTSEEAPSAPPSDISIEALSSQILKVTWKAPVEDYTKGQVTGYYLGYKEVDSKEQLQYKTLKAASQLIQEYRLKNLHKFTKYAVRVQAFNSAGSGPASDDKIAQTLQYDPPASPVVRLSTVGAVSALVEWEPGDETPVTAYIMSIRVFDQGEWIDQRFSSDMTSHEVKPLKCGTRYQLRLSALNSVGSGESSDIVQFKTEGTAPVAPSKPLFLNINSTFVLLNLDSWQTGGCPVNSFIVQYKATGEGDWLLVSSNIQASTEPLIISELSPGTWYNVLMTARNDAGSTDAEYVFATLTESGDPVSPVSHGSTHNQSTLYRLLSIVVPLVCAGVIVLVVTVVVGIVVTRRHAPQRYGPRQDGDDGGDNPSNANHKMDNMGMTPMGSKKGRSPYEAPKESLYFPAPYATSRLAAYAAEDGSECDSLPSSTRTTGDRNMSGHTYDVPFPVRRPEAEEQYTRIKRVPVPSVPVNNIYQTPQLPESERWNRRLSYHHQGLERSNLETGFSFKVDSPATRRWSGGYRIPFRKDQPFKLKRIDRDSYRYSDEGSDLEDEDERPEEISEAECDHITVGLPSFLRGPRFVREPPDQVVFLNTSGTMLSCGADGNPPPTVTWVKRDGMPVGDVPGLRHSRPDGSLVFPPFVASNYRQDVHSAVYRCLATNALGTIGSRDVHVRGVVHQDYEAHVYDEYVIRGNTAVMRCHVPSFVKEYHRVMSWTRDDGFVLVYTKRLASKYFVTASGDLLIRNADRTDSFRRYQCHVKNQLTGETKTSSAGQLILSDPTSSIPPRITLQKGSIQVLEGETAELVCASQGYPPPAYSWYRNRNGQIQSLDGGSNRVQIHEGTVLLVRVSSEDAGQYVCLVNNSLGTEKVETDLTVKANISVFLSPASASVEIGQSVSLNCTVQGYPVQSVTWMKNQRQIVPGNRIHILSGQLYMTSIQRDDQGVYQCMASGDGQSAQAATYLTLSEDAPTLKHVFSRQIIQRGERVSLRCVAVGNPLPRVTWTLDGRPIPESHRMQYGDFVSSVGEVVSFVNITSANSEDGGLYTCAATNEAGVSEHWDRVDIYGPPFIRPMGNLTVVAGEDLVYHCPVGGYPRPNVTWSKEGRRLPFNERQQVFSNGTLMVHNVTREADEGVYLCGAERGEIRVQREVKILVLKKPVINPFNIPSNLASGMRVIITCSVLMGDLPITIRWLKDGLPIKLQSLNLEETPIGDLGSSLIFAGIGRANNGNYTCLAENAAGEASYSDTMVVNVAPSWKLEPRDVSAIVGSNVVLDCQADGYPPPITRWKKSSDTSSPRNFQSVISNYHIQALENGSLIIKNAEIADEGFYLCEAVNGIGFGLSSSMRLSVHVAAHFKSNFIFVRARKGEELKIKCEAFGDRPLAVRWSKEKVKLDPDLNSRYSFNEETTDEGVVSNLVLNSADRRETGLYTCFATNTYGSDEKRIQVVVEEVPDPPGDVRVSEPSSRSVIVTWSVPYTGNSPISRYLIQWKKDPDPWKSSFKLETPGTDTKASLRDLVPVTKYVVRVSAENSMGTSDFSETVAFTTDYEVPEEPPQHVQATATSSHSIRVSWKPPSSHASYGTIQGYYVGYKIQNSPDPFVYKTLEVTFRFSEDCELTHLRRFTQYSVIVQAFNRKGPGPPSKEITCRTLENDPPQPPTLRIASSGVSSVNLAWDSLIDGDSDPTPVNGYTIYYKHGEAEWEHVNVSGDATSYAFQSLTCGTPYHFKIVATNAIGRSNESKNITVTTQGVAPIAPTKHQLLTVNSTSAHLNLQAWEDGGCPVTSFTVQLKSKGQSQWNVISSSVSPSVEKFVIPGLSPGSWYNLMMSAHNTVGSTEAEFVFSTLTTSGATVSPILLTSENSPSFYRSLPVVVPLVCSGVVLLVIVLVVLVVCLKRNRQRDNNAGNPEQENRGAGDGKGDNISMTSVGKKLYEAQREALYYPSPYATTRVSMYSAESESSSGHTSSLHRPADQRNQHIYDVPFPPKQFTYQTRNSGVVHDYQPLHPVSPQHEKTYGDFLFLNEDTTKPEAKFSEFKPYPMREWTKYNKLSNHRMKENNERMLRDIYGYHDGGPVDYESNPEDFEAVGMRGANSGGEIQEMSEAECDRDYGCDLKQAKDLSSLPFYMVRTPKPKSEYDVYLH